MTDEPTPARRRVRRGEGELTQWPRGLLDYVPTREAERTPDPEEDRTRNRILLAARLVGLLRAAGEDVEREVLALHRAEAALAAHDRASATEKVERLLADLDARTSRRAHTTP